MVSLEAENRPREIRALLKNAASECQSSVLHSSLQGRQDRLLLSSSVPGKGVKAIPHCPLHPPASGAGSWKGCSPKGKQLLFFSF